MAEVQTQTHTAFGGCGQTHTVCHGNVSGCKKQVSVSRPATGRADDQASAPIQHGNVAVTDNAVASTRPINNPAPVLPPHLKVVKQLGRGAYGEVFLCDDEINGKQLAVKCVRDFARDPTFGKRILREIRILAALDHPNLLKLSDLLPVPSPEFDDVYMAMPYMDLDLHKLIYSKMKISDGHAQAFACQILRGLMYLHSADIIHRDLKPSNILVNKDCTLRIADLGLARGRAYQEEQLTDYVVTRWYRAPELMLLPSGYFEAVDLWSVGCIHVELLARKPLFPGANHVDMLRRITRTLPFSRERDLAWLPQEEGNGFKSARQDVLRFVDALGLPEWPLQQPSDPLEKRIPNVSEVCFDFVHELLTYDPTRRISAADALAHKYLAHLHDSAAEVCAEKRFPWNFDCFEATKRALKERVYRECAKLHPEILHRDAEYFSRKDVRTPSVPLGPCPARLPRARGARIVTDI